MRPQKNVRSQKIYERSNARAQNSVFSAFAFCAHAQKSARAEARAQEKHAQGKRAQRKTSAHHNVHVLRTRACGQRAHAKTRAQKTRAHFCTLIVACVRSCGTRKLRARQCARAKNVRTFPRACVYLRTRSACAFLRARLFAHADFVHTHFACAQEHACRNARAATSAQKTPPFSSAPSSGSPCVRSWRTASGLADRRWLAQTRA